MEHVIVVIIQTRGTYSSNSNRSFDNSGPFNVDSFTGFTIFKSHLFLPSLFWNAVASVMHIMFDY